MTEIEPRSITYCGICSWPPEFCEFGLSKKKCQAWLETTHPDLYSRIYAASDMPNVSTLSLEKENKLSEELAKKEHKEELKQERNKQLKLSSKITIKRIERNKRKHIISISGLEIFEIDTKKLSKTFASKFATGTSVVKNAEKKDEILIQGDVSDEAKEYLEKLLSEKGLDDVKVEQIDDKAKKKKAQAAA
ncbi:Translation machinery-associated protein 22 [Candida viswanathii]|uniref:Translation machinery-associated protein 22 n=1 Tax=Candida viswanathii TaxID=5486 RepID=A0A367XZP2_9ASCO|nr:Translation machinery-associated protein 22 [Candida viswanathii]